MKMLVSNCFLFCLFIFTSAANSQNKSFDDLNTQKVLNVFSLNYGNGKEIFDDSHSEYLFSFERIKNHKSFRFDIGVFRNYGVISGDSPTSQYGYYNFYYTIPRIFAERRCFGLNLGLLFIYNLDGGSAKLPSTFVLPVGGIKLGLLDKIYLSANFFEEIIFLPISYGLGLKFENLNLSFWLGYVNYISEYDRNRYAFKSELIVKNRYVIRIIGSQNSNNSISGIRLGLGIVNPF